MFGLLPALAALFTFTDPVGDAHGDGSYVLPTRPAVSADALDLREFQVERGQMGLTFRVSLGATQNPWQLPSGFSAGITDIFVKGNLGGVNELPDLNLRVSEGWQYHLRVSGAGASLEQAQPDGKSTEPMTAPQVKLQGTTLLISTVIPPGNYGYWVTSSVYTPLSELGYMLPTAQVGPGNLTTARPNPPVPVDVLAREGDDGAYSTGRFAPVGQGRDFRPVVLSVLGGLGLLLTVLASLRVWRGGRRA